MRISRLQIDLMCLRTAPPRIDNASHGTLETGICRIRKVRREGCLKIYFAPDTRAVRIVWLFEELGLPYELEFFKLGIQVCGHLPTLGFIRWAACQPSSTTKSRSSSLEQSYNTC